MTHTPDIEAYLLIMQEIKRRTSVVVALSNGEIKVGYVATQIETMALQLRMILELVALASLSANKSLFEKNAKKFHKYWHAGEILKDIEKINPGFFPRPMKTISSKVPDMDWEFTDLQEGFMTREELIEVHGRCGKILHAQNPYDVGIDYHKFRKSIKSWIEQVICLLDCHAIHIINQPDIYLINMNENGGDRVCCLTFSPDKP